MIFGQLIERNMRISIFEKSCTKCDGDIITRPSSKKSKLSISLGQHSEILYRLNVMLPFMVWQVEDYQNILKLNCRPLVFTSYKAFLKNKISGASLSASFSA